MKLEVSWIPSGAGNIAGFDMFLGLVLEGKMIGKPARGRRILNILSDFTEKRKYVTLKSRVNDGEEWLRAEESWKSSTCFSADYLAVVMLWQACYLWLTVAILIYAGV